MAASLDPPERRPAAPVLPRSGLVLLVALTLFWGLNWPFMKLALADIPPFTFRALCLAGGACLLLGLSRIWRQPVAVSPALLPRLMLVAVFNITGWHLFSAFGLIETTSGRAAIVGYTMPLWASLLSALFLKVEIRRRHIIALALGMAALFLLMAQDLRVLGTTPVGALLMTGAALSWAIGTVLVKALGPWPIPVVALTGWQQLLGGAPVLIGMLLLEPAPAPSAWSLASIAGVVYAVVVATAFCHAAYFKLVELLPAHVAAIATLATPVVGVISGALMLGEAVGAAEIGALALVITGLFLLTRPERG